MSADSMMAVELRRELVRQVRDQGRAVAIEAANRFGVLGFLIIAFALKPTAASPEPA